MQLSRASRIVNKSFVMQQRVVPIMLQPQCVISAPWMTPAFSAKLRLKAA